MESIDYLSQHYAEHYNEDMRLLQGHGKVEYLTTMAYIYKYLAPGMKVLEIGAGTGRYSVALAQEGYAVTAVELIPHNLDILRGKITENMRLSALAGNALALDFLPEEGFDLTLLLGPMYHLYNEADKKQAIAQALRVTKPGGILAVAYCIAEGTIISYVFGKNTCAYVLENNMMDPKTFDLHSTPKDLFELVRKKDIDALMADFPAKRLHYLATDGLGSLVPSIFDEMDADTFQIYMNYHLAFCENEELIGATHHSLDVWRKDG